MAPSPTDHLVRRATSSSLGSSLSSSDVCKNNKSAACEKPVSTNSLEIGLGIGIPVAVVFAALGFLMYWRYRKNKKESLEHDPDFDENGDATALPDFPAFSKDDPFDNRFSVRPHSKHMDAASHLKSANEVGSVSTRMGTEDTPVDGFVLPYHHQTSSKASLEEFARQLVDNRLSGRRDSNLRYALVTPGASTHTSPQKSSLRYEQANVAAKEAPVGRLTKDDYRTIPNHFVTSLNANEYYNTKEEISDDTNDTSKLSENDFTVEYENEQEAPINLLLSNNHSPQKTREVTADEESEASDDFADASNSRGPFLEKEHEEEPPLSRNILNESTEEHADETFDEKRQEEEEEEEEERDEGEPRQVMPAIFVKSPFEEQNETFGSEQGQRLYDNSEVTGNTYLETTGDDTTEHRSLDPDPEGSGESKHHISRSPRLSAFDLLKNVSDDEGEGESQDRELDPEQEEELARMKSVYKVYFDRSNSTKTNATVNEDGSFRADATQPLPKIDIDHLKINDELKGDTQYDKRKTTTSSIYDEAPIFVENGSQAHPYQQYSMPHQQYPLQHPYAQLPPQQFMAPPPAENLPPLKSLPSASEIRRSTIETFTDYQPKHKGHKGTLPPGEASAASSPHIAQSGSFTTLKSPMSHDMLYNEDSEATPSPHQLSRTSVVMLDPVGEFKSQRKFKPAGSLPRQPSQPGYLNQDLAQSHEDLIPGNRKSAVRRMMNTNF